MSLPRMSTKEEMTYSIEQLFRNIDFYQRQLSEKEQHIRSLKTMNTKWINPDTMELNKDSYSKEEIIEAFMKAKVYEGLKTNEFQTVLDTFIEFLKGNPEYEKGYHMS